MNTTTFNFTPKLTIAPLKADCQTFSEMDDYLHTQCLSGVVFPASW